MAKAASSSKKTVAKTAPRPTRGVPKPAPKKTAPKAAASPKPKPAPTPAASPGPAAASRPGGPTLRKKDLIDRVVVASGVKKKDAKPVVEAMLEAMGDALSDGMMLQLPPLGKIRVAQTKSQANAEMLTCKLRRRTRPDPPLIEAAE